MAAIPSSLRSNQDVYKILVFSHYCDTVANNDVFRNVSYDRGRNAYGFNMKKSRFIFSTVLIFAVLAIVLSCDLLASKRYTVTYDGNNATGGIVPWIRPSTRTGQR
jgi:hypothetical protein